MLVGPAVVAPARAARAQGAAVDAGSSLAIMPAVPRPGATLRVRYRAAAALAAERRLALRARLHTRGRDATDGDVRHARVAILERGPDGQFTARVRLPDSVVYAAFAVEDLAGARVDSRGQRFWDVLVADRSTAAGRPSLAAYEARVAGYAEVDPMAMYRAARDAAAAYPDSVAAWQRLAPLEAAVLGPHAADRLRPAHRARFLRFAARFSAPGARTTPEQVAHMFRYAHQAADDQVERWRERVLPTATRAGVMEQAYAVRRRTAGDTVATLAGLEALWGRLEQEGTPRPGELADYGFRHAQALPDSAPAVRRWGLRYLALLPRGGGYVGAAFARVPALRPLGLAYLRAAAQADAGPNDAGPDDAVRPLYRTAPEQRAADGARLRRRLHALGEALLASGDTAAARDTLARAAAGGWTPALFRQLAALERAAGAAERAAAFAALAAVDPEAGPADADALRRAYAAGDPDAGWARRLDAARSELRVRVLAGAAGAGAVDLGRWAGVVHDTAGWPVRVRAADPDAATVVMFWSRTCAPAREDLPRVAALAPALRARGVRLVTFVDEPASADFRRFLAAQRLALPVYHDVRREAAHAFAQSGTPTYFVVDPVGRVRFPYTSLEALLRESLAVSPAAAGTGAATAR
jgi:hypothetical protein